MEGPLGEESSISVSMTLNVDYQQLSADDKDELKGKVQDGFAKGAGVDQSAVSVTLMPGSVLHVKIRTPDANSAESIENSMKESKPQKWIQRICTPFTSLTVY